MTAGLQIFGQHGVVQIDASYQNLGVSASGTVTLTLDPTPHPNHMQIGTITVTGETPILAFASADSPINVERVVISGSTHTFHVRTQSSVSASVDYWVFDKASVAIGGSSPQFFEVRDASGNLVFHDGIKPMRVVDFIYLGEPPNAWTGYTLEYDYHEDRTYTPGRSYAVIQCSLCARPETYDVEEQPYLPEPGKKWTANRFMHSAATVNGHQVNVGLKVFESFWREDPVSVTDTAWTVGNLMWLVVDVTGF